MKLESNRLNMLWSIKVPVCYMTRKDTGFQDAVLDTNECQCFHVICYSLCEQAWQ